MSIQPCRIRRHVVWHVDTAQEDKRVSFTFGVKGTSFYPEKRGYRFSRNAANNLQNHTTSHTHWGPKLIHCLFLARQTQSTRASRGFQITHNDALHSVGLLWKSDQLFTETSTWQHTTLTTDKHPYLLWDSNPQTQQASGRRPTP